MMKLQTLRNLIFLYFWLLILEGAVRKWLVPGLSNVLLVVRDPVMVAIIYLSIRNGIFNGSSVLLGFIVLFAVFAAVGAIQVIDGTVNLYIMLYGLRTYLLHLPLPFIMARVFDSNDLKRLCRLSCYIALAMTPVIILQFNSSPDAWINRGTMGDVALWNGAQQIVSAAGRIRAAGTFSYNLGVTFFFGYTLAIALNNELMTNFLPKPLTRAVLIATLMVVALSGSRTAVSEVAIVLVAFLGFMVTNIKLVGRGAFGSLAVIMALSLLLLSSAIFRTGLDVLQTRFAEASELEANDATDADSDLAFLGRVNAGIVDAFDVGVETPLTGRGLGLGTNVGSKLSTGSIEFLLSEDEWPRIIMECGPILGSIYVGLRLVFTLWLGWKAIALAYRRGSCLAMLLCSACAYNLIFGQWGPPTTLGLAMFVAGACMAALNLEPKVGMIEGRWQMRASMRSRRFADRPGLARNPRSDS